MTARLEHANIAVHDIDGVATFLQAAFPEFSIRYEGVSASGLRWVHVGNDDTYVALYEAGPAEPRRGTPYSGRPGLNHLGYEVDDAHELRDRLLRAGYRESTTPNTHPFRRRIYFYDPEGNDWEFVQYLTKDSQKRHDYELADS